MIKYLRTINYYSLSNIINFATAVNFCQYRYLIGITSSYQTILRKIRKGDLTLTIIQLFRYKLSIMTTVPAKPDAKELWEGKYPTSQRIFETCSIIFTVCLWLYHIKWTLQVPIPGPIFLISGFFISQLIVDFLSGIVHWACDTWGKFQTPIVGPTLIRGFRMHHVDPQQITRHGFVQTNGATTIPIPLFIFVSFIWEAGQYQPVLFYQWMVNFGVVPGILINQIHKWAHTDPSKLNPIIRLLQKCRLILSHQHHHKHHQAAFDRSYCIINGWMNPILESFDFWRKFQKYILNKTGNIPRSDDAFWRKLKQ